MSIYIPGMKMPKGCAFCKISRRNGNRMVCPLCCEEWDIHDPMSADFRLQNCPLVPVPDHGRSIDADLLCKVLQNNAEDELNKSVAPYSWSYAYECVQDTIKNMPTIIPAEEGEG